MAEGRGRGSPTGAKWGRGGGGRWASKTPAHWVGEEAAECFAGRMRPSIGLTARLGRLPAAH